MIRRIDRRFDRRFKRKKIYIFMIRRLDDSISIRRLKDRLPMGQISATNYSYYNWSYPNIMMCILNIVIHILYTSVASNINCEFHFKRGLFKVLLYWPQCIQITFNLFRKNLIRILISKKILNHANYIFINVNDETQKNWK